MKSKNKILYLLILCGVSLNLFAKTKVEESVQQRQSFEAQKEQFLKLENNSKQKILFYETKEPVLDNVSGKKCVQIKTIKEDTLTLLSKSEKSNILKKYEKGCRTINELNNLTKELTTLYINKGYITSKVYFKAQKLNQGILEIIAVEGKVNDITPNKLFIENGFLAQRGDYLNLRELEAAIESINRLPSNNATMKIVPAQKTGMSNIEVTNNPTNRVNGNIGVDNYGTEKSGKYQGSLNLNLDNPLGINDQFGISFNTTNKHSKPENSKGNGFVYSFPLGNRLLNILSYRKSSYKQLLRVGITDFETKGYTDIANYNLKYKLFHNQNNRFNIGAFISRYDTENFIEDSQIETSSYALSTKGLEVDYLFQQQGFYSLVAFSYTKGTDWFGTHNPTSLDEKFSYHTLDISVMKQFLQMQYSLNGHYQYTKDSLFGNNQISIGGPYSVRGYNKEGLSGNRGYYFRNELQKTFKTKLFSLLTQTYFITYDYGSINKDEDVDGGILASYSIGAKYKYNDFSIQTYYATPLRKKDVIQTNKFFGVSMGYRF